MKLTDKQRMEARKASKRRYEQSDKGRASTKRSNDKYRAKQRAKLARLKELENERA